MRMLEGAGWDSDGMDRDRDRHRTRAIGDEYHGQYDRQWETYVGGNRANRNGTRVVRTAIAMSTCTRVGNMDVNIELEAGWVCSDRATRKYII
jgi:hypothetical protein